MRDEICLRFSSVGRLSFDNILLTLLVKLYSLNMYLMALCWIISILFMYFFCQGSHTEAAYSTKGRTYVLYADSFSLGLLVWMLRLMNFNELLVFIVIWLMCFAHDKSREILTPKYHILQTNPRHREEKPQNSYLSSDTAYALTSIFGRHCASGL